MVTVGVTYYSQCKLYDMSTLIHENLHFGFCRGQRLLVYLTGFPPSNLPCSCLAI